MENAFDILSYAVKCEGNMKEKAFSEAKVRIRVGKKIEHVVAEGDGPVNALDTAIRKALVPHFPELSAVRFEDYRVNINNGDDGTNAPVEVMIISSNGPDETWTVTAVSTDIIRASIEALVKSFRNAPVFSKKTMTLKK